MSELTEETNEFINLINNKENFSSIQDYYNVNKNNIDISADNDYVFRNICKNNNIELVKFLYPLKLWSLKVEQDEDLRDIYYTAFSFCCDSGYLEIAQWILKVEPNNNFNMDDIFGCVCMEGRLHVAKWLLEINPDMDISIDDEFNFCWACENGHLDVAKWLLEVKSNIDISTGNEYAFQTTCRNNHFEIAKWLLEVKPDIDISNDNEEAFKNACDNGHLEIAKWLLEVKPDIDISNDNDFVFRNACFRENLELVQFLMEIKPEKYVVTIENNKLIDYKVKVIITKTIEKSKIPKELETCYICQTSISNIYTPCHHLYCEDCITSWLGNKNSCPYCRNEINIHDIMMIV